MGYYFYHDEFNASTDPTAPQVYCCNPEYPGVFAASGVIPMDARTWEEDIKRTYSRPIEKIIIISSNQPTTQMDLPDDGADFGTHHDDLTPEHIKFIEAQMDAQDLSPQERRNVVTAIIECYADRLPPEAEDAQTLNDISTMVHEAAHTFLYEEDSEWEKNGDAIAHRTLNDEDDWRMGEVFTAAAKRVSALDAHSPCTLSVRIDETDISSPQLPTRITFEKRLQGIQYS